MRAPNKTVVVLLAAACTAFTRLGVAQFVSVKVVPFQVPSLTLMLAKEIGWPSASWFRLTAWATAMARAQSGETDMTPGVEPVLGVMRRKAPARAAASATRWSSFFNKKMCPTSRAKARIPTATMR